MTASASQLRRDAATRLADVAGAIRIDIDLTLSRSEARAVLWRKALRAAGDDQVLRDQVLRDAALIDASAAGLIDAVHDDTPTGTPAGPPITLDDVKHALSGWDQGDPHAQ